MKGSKGQNKIKEKLEYDIDVLEPYKIEIRVDVINSKIATREFTKLLNERYGRIKLNSENFLVKFTYEDFFNEEYKLKWYQSTTGRIFIYDSFLNDSSQHLQDICKAYNDANSAIQFQPGAKLLVIMNTKLFDTSELKAIDPSALIDIIITDKDTPNSTKVINMNENVKAILTKLTTRFKEEFDNEINSNTGPLKFTEVNDAALDSYIEYSEKWMIDIGFQSQNTGFVIERIENDLNEARKQNNNMLISTLELYKAATLAKMKEDDKNQIILTSPKKDNTNSFAL